VCVNPSSGRERAPAAKDRSPVVTVAVLDFDGPNERAKEMGREVSLLLTARLSGKRSLATVERERLDLALSEQELGLSGLVSSATASQIGQLTGAKLLVTGKVLVLGDKLHVVVKIIGTETSRVFGESARQELNGALPEMTERLADKVAKNIDRNREQLVAEHDKTGDFLKRLARKIEGSDRPVVSISITETHNGRRSLDPAAEIEFTRALIELGFTVVDSGMTAQAPSIEIVGEAISEFGSRRGNLVSCRGRVEITAVERDSGNIVAAARQMAIGIDIGDELAGKIALQRAAQRLVEQIVPSLVR
jgi:TolB-like protein